MITPTKEVLQAISRADRNFEVFCEWLKDSRANAVDRIVSCPDADLPAARQNLRTLDDILKTIDSAKDELRTMEELSANTAGADR